MYKNIVIGLNILNEYGKMLIQKCKTGCEYLCIFILYYSANFSMYLRNRKNCEYVKYKDMEIRNVETSLEKICYQGKEMKQEMEDAMKSSEVFLFFCFASFLN